MASSYSSLSPYQYALNNPIMNNDPTGLYHNPFGNSGESGNIEPGSYSSNGANFNFQGRPNRELSIIERSSAMYRAIRDAWNSEHGGHWSTYNGFAAFKSEDQAKMVGLSYLEYHNGWSQSAYGASSSTRSKLYQFNSGAFFQLGLDGTLYVPYTLTKLSDYNGAGISEKKDVLKSFGDGFIRGAEATWDWVKYSLTWEGYKSQVLNVLTMGGYGMMQTAESAPAIVESAPAIINKISTADANDWAYGAGFATEKLGEMLIMRRVQGINPFGLRGGNGLFGRNGLKIGNYKIDALYANPSAGRRAGTIFSLKQMKQGGALWRWDYGKLHSTGRMALHSSVRFKWRGKMYGSSGQRTWYPSSFKAPFFDKIK